MLLADVLHCHLLWVHPPLVRRGKAEKSIGLDSLAEERGEAMRFPCDVKGSVHLAVLVEILFNPNVAFARREFLNVLLIRRLGMSEGSQLRVGSCIHRDDVGILLVENFRVAIHAQTIAREELLKLLALALVKVRLVHNNERVRDLHGCRGKVLTEEDLDVSPVERRGIGSLRVLNGLCAQLCLVGATENVGTLDVALLKHQTNELLVGPCLSCLALRLQKCIAQLLLKEGLPNVGGGRDLLGGRHFGSLQLRMRILKKKKGGFSILAAFSVFFLMRLHI